MIRVNPIKIGDAPKSLLNACPCIGITLEMNMGTNCATRKKTSGGKEIGGITLSSRRMLQLYIGTLESAGRGYTNTGG